MVSYSDLYVKCTGSIKPSWFDLYPITGCTNLFGDVSAGDPFVLALNRNSTTAETFSYHSSTNSHWRTKPYTENNSMWYNLQLFNDTVFGKKRKKPKGNWKPRFRATQSGVSLSDASENVFTFSNVPLTGTGHHFSDVSGFMPYLSMNFIQMYRSSETKFVADWRHLHNFAKQVQSEMSEYGTSTFRTRRETAAGGGHRYDSTITDLIVEDDLISYDFTWSYWSIQANRTHTIVGTMYLSRAIEGLPFVNHHLRFASQYLSKKCGTATAGSKPITDRQFINAPAISVGDQSEALGFVDQHAHNIMGAAPVLYLTQCQALGELIGDLHSNFETLVESQEFINALSELYIYLPLMDKLDIQRFFQDLDFEIKFFRIADHVLILIRFLRLIAKGYLTWIFALKPTFDTIIDVFDRCTRLPLPKYEAQRSFTSDDYDFTALNEGLQSYALSNLPISAEDVSSFKMVFHTEISAKIDTDYILGVLQGPLQDVLYNTGSIPELAYAYKAQAFTWVLEAFVPLGKMLEYAETYFRSDRSVIETLGHSVYISITSTDGRHFQTYLRSDNTTTTIFPPPNCWIDPAGAESVLVPVSIIAGLGVN